MSDKTIVITEDAQQVIIAMRNKIHQARAYVGEEDPYYCRMAFSFGISLSTMIGLGGKITADGDLSLYCMNEFIHYGVNFHNRKHPQEEEFPFMKEAFGEWSVNS